MPDNRTLLCRFVPTGRGAMPEEPRVPEGPVTQETIGVKAQVRTYQDLLQNAHDEKMYDWLLTTQLALVSSETGARKDVGSPAIFSMMDVSPSGEYLLVARTVKPYSYLVPDAMFPEVFEVWTLANGTAKELHRAGLREQIPIEGVETGPRDFAWRDTAPAQLVYAEALDGGDPKNKADFRDRVLTLDPPFAEAREAFKTQHRFRGISWMAPAEGIERGGSLALVSEYDRDRKWSKTWVYNASDWSEGPRVLWDRSVNDRYNAPGTPLRTRLANGRMAVRAENGFMKKKYNTLTDTWASVNRIPTVRSPSGTSEGGSKAVTIGNSVYVLGGSAPPRLTRAPRLTGTCAGAYSSDAARSR
jgi:hypothetical protein